MTTTGRCRRPRRGDLRIVEAQSLAAGQAGAAGQAWLQARCVSAYRPPAVRSKRPPPAHLAGSAGASGRVQASQLRVGDGWSASPCWGSVMVADCRCYSLRTVQRLQPLAPGRSSALKGLSAPKQAPATGAGTQLQLGPAPFNYDQGVDAT